MSLSIIVAMDRNRVIGKDNKLPWHLPAELRYFKQTTMGHPVIMGRKTHESIGRPLPGRENIVLTRNRGYQSAGCKIAHTPAEAIAMSGDREAFVIGGAEVIKLLFPHVSRLYITWIDHEFSGDTFFPEIRSAEWRLIREEPGVTDAQNPYRYTYRVYERNHP